MEGEGNRRNFQPTVGGHGAATLKIGGPGWTQNRSPLYPIIGNLCAWLCLAGFAVVASVAVVRGRRTTRATPLPREGLAIREGR